jgi:hypothetical protein
MFKTESTLGTEVLRHAFNRLGQRWQVLFDHQPDRSEVNAQITMHDHISKPGKFAPRNLRFGEFDFTGQALARFRQGLSISDHCVLHQT